MKLLQTLLNKHGYNLAVDGVAGKMTLAATTSFLKLECEKRNFVFETKGLIYIRLDQNLTDTFDDICCRINAGVVDMVTPCSTTAGDYYLFNPITYNNITGTAVAKEQQVLFSHQYVTGRTWVNLWSKMPYFQQIKPIYIFRDGNKDRVLNKTHLQFGLFGINLHRGWSGAKNWNCSAGCQIVPDVYWQELIKIFLPGEYIGFTLMEIE